MKKTCLAVLFLLFAAVGFSQVTFIKNLENQNVTEESYDSLTNTVYFMPYADSLNTCAVWFNFGLTGYRKDTFLTFTADFQNRMHIPNFPVYSYDMKSFYTVEDADFTGLMFHTRFYPARDTVYFMTGLPYTCSDFENFYKAHSGSENLRMTEYIDTQTERKIHVLTVGNAKYLSPKKKLIWIICRQHAFESVSNYVTEGMLRYLFSRDCSRKILRRYVFKIIPIVDVNGVFSGQTGRMSLPVDFNRDWADCMRPEIRAIKEKIIETAAEYHYFMFWDIHGTFPGGDRDMNNFSYFSLLGDPQKTANIHMFWKRFGKFMNYEPSEFKDDNTKNYNGLTADWWNFKTFKELEFSFTLEMDWGIDKHFQNYTPETYYEIGESMIKSLIKYRPAR